MMSLLLLSPFRSTPSKARRLRQRVRHREVETVGQAPAHAEDQAVVAAFAVADRGAERLRIRPDGQIREAAEAGGRVAIVVAEADVQVATVDVDVVDSQRGRGRQLVRPADVGLARVWLLQRWRGDLSEERYLVRVGLVLAPSGFLWSC